MKNETQRTVRLAELTSEYEQKTTKVLLEIAKELDISGRHDMKKMDLVRKIVMKYISPFDSKSVLLEEDARVDVVNQDTADRIGAIQTELSEAELSEAELDEIFAEESVETKIAMEAKDVKVQWDNNSSTELYPGTERISKTRSSYVSNAQVGQLVAFKVSETKVISAMVKEVHPDFMIVETKNGIRFKVVNSNIVWVKTGPRWPRGIYLALRGTNE